MKKNLFNILAVAVIGFSLVSCSNPSKMAKEANLVTVTCSPVVLEVVADEITATYTMNFPEKYFHPKALLEITPVLVYKGGEVAAPLYFLQGEKITDNNRMIPVMGGKSTQTVKFAYKPGMEKSHLELRATVWSKTKKYPFPAPYKLADGANTTYKLIHGEGEVELAPHKYQKVIAEKKEAQILYKINDAKVNKKELTKQDIKEFEAFLAYVDKDQKRAVKSTDIVAYASPDGGMDINSKLSDKRGTTAKEAFGKIKNTPSGAPVNVSTIAEDWEGFQELVAASNVQDKELILRVLSMYSDPMVREREIRNMSKVFKILADKVLPELRRARFIANVDYTNFTEEELLDLAKNNIEALDLESLLYTATLVKDIDTKIALYKKAGDKFNCSRGYNNLAATYINSNKLNEAKVALTKVTTKDTYYYNNMGVIALREKDLKAAADNFSKSNLTIAKYNSAIIDILQGKYAVAASKLEGSNEANECIADILTNQLDKASKAIASHSCPHSAYLRAIIAARKGNAAEVKAQLEKATKMKGFAERAKTDIEFAKYQ
jgi:Tfp pilus assembly protein PilE